jgi:hypothetical protein
MLLFIPAGCSTVPENFNTGYCSGSHSTQRRRSAVSTRLLLPTSL